MTSILKARPEATRANPPPGAGWTLVELLLAPRNSGPALLSGAADVRRLDRGIANDELRTRPRRQHEHGA